MKRQYDNELEPDIRYLGSYSGARRAVSEKAANLNDLGQQFVRDFRKTHGNFMWGSELDEDAREALGVERLDRLHPVPLWKAILELSMSEEVSGEGDNSERICRAAIGITLEALIQRNSVRVIYY